MTHHLSAAPRIPSEIYFPNLLGSAAKSAHSGTPWGPNRRLACQLDEAEGLLKASFSSPNKPRRRPATFRLSSRSERGRCQHVRPSSSRRHLLMGRDETWVNNARGWGGGLSCWLWQILRSTLSAAPLSTWRDRCIPSSAFCFVYLLCVKIPRLLWYWDRLPWQLPDILCLRVSWHF